MGSKPRPHVTEVGGDDGRPALLFLGSPVVADLEHMTSHGLYLYDIPLHDMSRDLVLLAEQRQAEAELRERYEKLATELQAANARLQLVTRWLDEERRRSDGLLYRMLPADIAADLREGRRVEAIHYPEVTVLFCDVVGYMVASSLCSNEAMYDMLNELYDRFDGLADEYPDVYKLETVSDAYLLAVNLSTRCDAHVDTALQFGLRMLEEAGRVRDARGEPVRIRIGVHTGPVAGGVLGARTPRFSVYGDTVNVASRMESHGLPGRIHITAASYARIADRSRFVVSERGCIPVKGRGCMQVLVGLGSGAKVGG
ncbi:hypothetical protein GPECTOR_20g535 [Gonium pectorale]|uniref:guanylate cyclase n=1 Tax=Gonium pectorale TaxID=33097 RepID=A0A150GIN3_GONPE|nr:hypothetical protein GPECTOR_20g535 [Gonium pectorale]|eukprot:KXZ49678.1 hypothetical protein GPECTOR_20g535 [Gonium pectorale]